MTSTEDSISVPLDQPGEALARPRLPAAVLGPAIFVLALNLRMGISSVGPVLPQVVHDLDVTLVYASLLTTLPVVMMGVASPLSARLGAKFGLERTVIGAIAIVGIATAARYWATSPITLLVAAMLLGCGIAAGNTMLPAVVRRYFPAHGALLTGIYAVGINIGAGTRGLRDPTSCPESLVRLARCARHLGDDGRGRAGTLAARGDPSAATRNSRQRGNAAQNASSLDSGVPVRCSVDGVLRDPCLAGAAV